MLNTGTGSDLHMYRKKHYRRRRRVPSTEYRKLRIPGHILSVLGAVILLLCITFYGAGAIICLGPSSAARDLFVNTVTQTSAAGFLARIWLSEDQIDEILAENETVPAAGVTDTSAVRIAADSASSSSSGASASSGISVEDVSGSTYCGKMMLISDPSRVSIYTIDTFATGGSGKQLLDMIQETGAVAGMNAGGFYDPDGKGHGGMPLGAVIKNGTLVSDYASDYKTMIGFDSRHRLIVGDMSASDAISMGMQDGITFGPALVINGQRVPYNDNAGGLNPRSAIGQRSDGTILLLVIDGRQPRSLGASFKDLCDVMLDYGAVNAGNLDGGSSSLLYYQGQQLNTSASMIGLRPLPTAILVR